MGPRTGRRRPRTLVPAGLQHVDVAGALVLAAVEGRLGAGRRKVRPAPAARMRAWAPVHADLALHPVYGAADRRIHARQVEARQRCASRDDAPPLGAPGAPGAIGPRQRAAWGDLTGRPPARAACQVWGRGGEREGVGASQPRRVRQASCKQVPPQVPSSSQPEQDRRADKLIPRGCQGEAACLHWLWSSAATAETAGRRQHAPDLWIAPEVTSEACYTLTCHGSRAGAAGIVTRLIRPFGPGKLITEPLQGLQGGLGGSVRLGELPELVSTSTLAPDSCGAPSTKC